MKEGDPVEGLWGLRKSERPWVYMRLVPGHLDCGPAAGTSG